MPADDSFITFDSGASGNSLINQATTIILNTVNCLTVISAVVQSCDGAVVKNRFVLTAYR